MQDSKSVVDPELEKIKSQLKMIGVMIVASAVVLPFGLPAWFNIPTIVVLSIAAVWWSFKRKERSAHVERGETK